MQISGGIVMSGNWNIPGISPAPAPANVTYKWFIGESAAWAGTSNTILVPGVIWGRINLGTFGAPIWTSNNQLGFQLPMTAGAGPAGTPSRAKGYLSGQCDASTFRQFFHLEFAASTPCV